jgi:hypothetical protein
VIAKNDETKAEILPGANTVIDPLAVMVKALYASVADEAVARVRCASDLAGGTQSVGVNLLHQLQEGNSFGLVEVTRVF